MRYREHFNLTWDEFLATPWDVVTLDLAILDVESTVKLAKQRKR